jgi:hypothetical protein
VAWLAGVSLCLWLLVAGCAAPPRASVDRAPFTFARDTFSYANELVWEYGYNAEGKWRASIREPEPDYTHRCFVVARSALQFYHHAEFAPHLPVSDEAAYRKRIREVVKRSLRRAAKPGERVIIPGFSNLFEFSQSQTTLLQKHCGGAWQSYFQRGHWRMLFPFPRRQQAATAERIFCWVNEARPVVIHVVRFPKLSINHALVVYGGTRTADGIDFAVYDPNDPERPERLHYVKTTRTFYLPQNDYFRGGRVDVYPVFHNWAY